MAPEHSAAGGPRQRQIPGDYDIMQSHTMRHLVTALLFGPWLFVAAVSADVEAGFKAYKAGDYVAAFNAWRAEAQRGNGVALQQLGGLYERGEGVAADPYIAFVLYRVALGTGNRSGEVAANRVANDLQGDDLVNGVSQANRLVLERRYLPDLPGAPRIAAVPPPPPPPPPAAQPARPAQPVMDVNPPTTRVAKQFDYRLACRMQLRYQDKGSGGLRDLALFDPQPEPGYFIVGGMAQSGYDSADDCVLSLRAGPGVEHLLVPPAGWDRVWRDKGTGAHMDGSIWRARSPDADHVCLGDVGQTGKETPYVQGYMCVHRCLVAMVPPTNPLWTTEGTGARDPAMVYRLSHARGFVAVTGGQPPAQLADLDPNATCH